MKRILFLLALMTGALSAAAGGAADSESRASHFNIQAAADYLESRNGHALLVYHKGDRVFEAYFNGHTADKAHRLASGTKSFSGVLAVMAMEDGLLDLDEAVSKTITEWKDDPQKSRITIRQLISLSGGIDGGDNGNTPSGKEAIAMASSTTEPGASFSYGPIPFQVWGDLLRRKLEPKGETVEEYMQRRLMDPIELKVEYWRKDEDGAIQFPAGAFITAREWAKFGLFVLAGGEWNGERLVSRKGLKQCFESSEANPNYGLTFWLSRWDDMPGDLVMAAGKGKQKLYMIPSEDLLIVQLAEAQGYGEKDFLDRFFSKPGTEFDNETGRPDPVAAAPDQANENLARLRAMDTNGDEQLTAEEAKEWEFFTQADEDNDGIATGAEIGKFLRSRRR
ncbi:MAG: serine hydrolase [Verrucomicrobia bacterium]|nr:serine hydrolase [Verrucomicrobiota bacterium]MDA1067770.1 serine hydrolase [Verrucomicrobiota bacterium]